MRITVCGKRWDLRYTNLQTNHGECDSPDKPGKEIRIDRQLEGIMELEVLIHELLHSADWRAAEEHVSESARDIAKVLWKIGYRKS